MVRLIYFYFFSVVYFMWTKKSNTFLTSLFLAIAISVKLVPVFLLLYLLIRKEYKLIMYVVFLTFVFILLPAVIIGENIFTYYSFYFQKFLSANLSPALNEEYQSGMFFSLTGLIIKHLYSSYIYAAFCWYHRCQKRITWFSLVR